MISKNGGVQVRENVSIYQNIPKLQVGNRFRGSYNRVIISLVLTHLLGKCMDRNRVYQNLEVSDLNRRNERWSGTIVRDGTF